MEPNLPLPGLISLSWVFLGPFGRLYCQHLPPILAQGPPRNGAKPALTRADPPIFRLCQHLPPILAQGPPRNGAKPALTKADPPILGLSWALGRLYCQHLLPRAPHAMEPNLPLPGLIPSGPVRPVRPCLVRPLGLCPMAGLWRLFLVWSGGALTRPYAVWASASRQALLSKAPWSLPRGGRVAANSVWPGLA